MNPAVALSRPPAMTPLPVDGGPVKFPIGSTTSLTIATLRSSLGAAALLLGPGDGTPTGRLLALARNSPVYQCVLIQI